MSCWKPWMIFFMNYEGYISSRLCDNSCISDVYCARPVLGTQSLWIWVNTNAEINFFVSSKFHFDFKLKITWGYGVHANFTLDDEFLKIWVRIISMENQYSELIKLKNTCTWHHIPWKNSFSLIYINWFKR